MKTTLKIGNCYSQLLSDNLGLLKILHENMRFREKNYFHSRLYKQKLWDGYTDFFSKKTPTTIANARLFLNAQGKDTTPLNKQDLHTLISSFKTAQQSSSDYRAPATQIFYDHVASFDIEPEAKSDVVDSGIQL